MMSRLTIIAIFCIFSVVSYSQQESYTPPEYEKIRLQISDNSSPYFYPKLFERYRTGDSSLSVNDFRYLYYGYTFQSQYVPYQVSRYQDKILTYLRKGSLTEKELDELIKLSELNLKDLPFDIRTLNILAYCYKQKKDTLIQSKFEFRKERIIGAIKSSGDGMTEKTAFHVIDPIHEMDFLKEMGLQFAGANDMSAGFCEYLYVAANELGIRGYFFNIGQIINIRTSRNQ